MQIQMQVLKLQGGCMNLCEIFCLKQLPLPHERKAYKGAGYMAMVVLQFL